MQNMTAKIRQEMQEVADYRETVQPVKSRTGGSTFKNPPGKSAWKLIDHEAFDADVFGRDPKSIQLSGVLRHCYLTTIDFDQ